MALFALAVAIEYPDASLHEGNDLFFRHEFVNRLRYDGLGTQAAGDHYFETALFLAILLS